MVALDATSTWEGQVFLDPNSRGIGRFPISRTPGLLPEERAFYGRPSPDSIKFCPFNLLQLAMRKEPGQTNLAAVSK